MTYGKTIRMIRYFYGLSQKDFAKRINYGNSYLSDIENDLRKPSEKFRLAVIREFPRTSEFERFLIEAVKQTNDLE